MSNERRPLPTLSEAELPAITPLEFVVDRGDDGAPVLDVRESEFEQVYNLQDAHSYWLFVALCREQGITLYKRRRQRATTVCAKTTLTKHDALWQRFVELSRGLHARLGEVAAGRR